MMGVCQWNPTSKEPPGVPVQWYSIYHRICRCIFEVAGPCLLIPRPKNNTKHPSLSLWDLAVCSNPKVALHAAPLARAHQATLHTKHPEWYVSKKMENMNRWEGPDWCHSRLRRLDWMASISPFELQESLLQTFPSCPTGDIYGHNSPPSRPKFPSTAVVPMASCSKESLINLGSHSTQHAGCRVAMFWASIPKDKATGHGVFRSTRRVLRKARSSHLGYVRNTSA